MRALQGQLLRLSAAYPTFISKILPTEKPQAGFFALNTVFNTGLYYSLLPAFAVTLIEKLGQRRVFHDMNHVDEVL